MSQQQAKRYRRNVRILVWLQALRSFYISIPVYAPFILANGLVAGDIFLLRSGFAVTVLVVDAPCGYLADHWGSRRCLVLGSLALFAGSMLFVLGHSFAVFLVAEVCNAVSFALFSGADSALLYDSLAAQDAEDQYQRLESRATVRGRLGEGTASLLAAAILTWATPRWAFVVAAARAALFTVLSLRLVEPPRDDRAPRGGLVRAFYQTWRTAFVATPSVGWLIAISATIGGVAIAGVWLTQALFVERLPDAPGGLPVLLLACHASGALLTATIAPRVPRHATPIALVALVGVLSAIHAVMGLGGGAWVLLAAIPFQIHWSRVPLVQRSILDRVAPGERATVLSWMSVLTRSFEALLTLVIGALVTDYGASAGFLLTASILGVAAVAGMVTSPAVAARSGPGKTTPSRHASDA